MDKSSLKTSVAQRIAILVIAILLVGTMIFAYLFIILESNSNNAEVASMDELQEQYNEKNAAYEAAVKKLSDQYFKELNKYKANVKAYNAATANSEGLKIKDLKEGTGKQLAEGDYSYNAYYIGWCPDGSIFDSSLDDNENPTTLKAPMTGSANTVAGWKEGVVGMKIGGIREITMNSDLGYGEDRDLCNTDKGTPLKFIVMMVEEDEELKKTNEELQDLLYQVYSQTNGSSTNVY